MAPIVKKRKIDVQGKWSNSNHSSKSKESSIVPREFDDLTSEGSSSDEEESRQPSGRSYNTLLRSLGPISKVNKREVHSRPNGDSTNLLYSTPSGDVAPNNAVNKIPKDPLDQVDEDEDSHEDADDPTDLFTLHFSNPDTEWLNDQIKIVEATGWKTHKSDLEPTTNFNVTIPDHKSNTPSRSSSLIRSVQDLSLKRKLSERAKKMMPQLSSLQRSHGRVIFNYHDLIYGGRTVENEKELRQLGSLHALNHVLKTRDLVIKNNARLAKEEADSDLELRDQGFTRPKVLILLETRQACARYMETISELWDPEQQENRKRFEDAFIRTGHNFSEEKPADFRELFEGNDDNEFRLGIKFTRKTIKYYSKFYNSDVIFASPLGLRRAINAEDPKKKDADFLSSIEVLIIDQADAMLQQNFSHVTHVLSYLNLLPTSSHDTDFSRVRNYYLDGHIKYLRQTIIFSAYLTPDLNSLYSSYMNNVSGKWKTHLEHTGSMLQIHVPHLRQTFTRFTASSPATEPDERFQYFINTLLPSIKHHIPDASSENDSSSSAGILIYIPSYFDFIRLQNYLTTKEELTFGTLSEYTPTAEISRARSYFRNGSFPVILYSGRLHHFRRFLIRGAKRVLFYGLPENPLFYSEVAGKFLDATAREKNVAVENLSVRALFSKWDVMALERIVGTERANKMVKGDLGDTFDFR